MPVKTKPVSGQSSWGNVLNTHLEQLIPNSGGGINTFDVFTNRPIYKAGTSTPLDADDVGLTYLFTQTGNLHRWSGTQWKVLNESVINVKDYGAVGDGVADDTTVLQYCFHKLSNSIPEWWASSSLDGGTTKIYFPRGRYIISDIIRVPRGITIIGDNARNSCTSLIQQITQDKYIFDLFGYQTKYGTQREADQRIEHLSFKSAGGGIRALKEDYVNIESGSTYSIGSLMINNCYFLDITGHYCINTDSVEQISNNTFDHCEYGGIRCSGARIINNIFFVQGHGAITFDSTIGSPFNTNNEHQVTSSIVGNIFNGCGSGGNSAFGNIIMRGNYPLENINISNNVFNTMDGGGAYGILGETAIENLVINGNIFANLRGDAIILNNTNYSMITNNTFKKIKSFNIWYGKNVLSVSGNKNNISNNTFSGCTLTTYHIKITGNDNIIANTIEDVPKKLVEGLGNIII